MRKRRPIRTSSRTARAHRLRRGRVALEHLDPAHTGLRLGERAQLRAALGDAAWCSSPWIRYAGLKVGTVRVGPRARRHRGDGAAPASPASPPAGRRRAPRRARRRPRPRPYTAAPAAEASARWPGLDGRGVAAPTSMAASRGRIDSSNAASPGSALPWWETLSTSTDRGRAWRGRRTRCRPSAASGRVRPGPRPPIARSLGSAPECSRVLAHRRRALQSIRPARASARPPASRTGTARALATIRSPRGSRTPSRPSRTSPTGIARSTAAAPPSWSACVGHDEQVEPRDPGVAEPRDDPAGRVGRCRTRRMCAVWMSVASPWPCRGT